MIPSALRIDLGRASHLTGGNKHDLVAQPTGFRRHPFGVELPLGESGLQEIEVDIGQYEGRLVTALDQQAATGLRGGPPGPELTPRQRDYQRLTARELAETLGRQPSEAETAELHEKQSALESRLAAFDSDIAQVDDRLRQAERRVAELEESILELNPAQLTARDVKATFDRIMDKHK